MLAEPIPGRGSGHDVRVATVLPGGRAVRVRAASLGDAGPLREMLSRLSPRSIYLRFHAPYPRAPEWAVARFLEIRDGQALVAVAGREVVGHAMYARSGAGSSDAEFAIVVEDAWQSRGIGKLLLSRLAVRAGERGVEDFFCEVLGENRRVLGLARAVFGEVGYAPRSGAYLLRAPLASLGPGRGAAGEGG